MGESNCPGFYNLCVQQFMQFFLFCSRSIFFSFSDYFLPSLASCNGDASYWKQKARHENQTKKATIIRSAIYRNCKIRDYQTRLSSKHLFTTFLYYTIPAFDPLQTVSLSEDEAVGGGAGSGSQQNRLFRNVAATADSGAPFVPPSYPAGHYDHHDHGYSYQTFNGQYVNTGQCTLFNSTHCVTNQPRTRGGSSQCRRHTQRETLFRWFDSPLLHRNS